MKDTKKLKPTKKAYEYTHKIFSPSVKNRKPHF